MANKAQRLLLSVVLLVALSSITVLVASTPDGATVDLISNTTKASTTGTIGNATATDGTAGGYIFTINLTGANQNTRWKAFVGNASGRLVLDDASGNTIYDWSLTVTTGEVYTTRHSGTINWTGIGCGSTNVTELENTNLSHSNADDNITATFGSVNSEALAVGTVTIGAGECPATHVYQNSTGTNQFEEVILYDGSNNGTLAYGDGTPHDAANFSNIVYAQNLEDDLGGYDNGTSYDFQLIVPEVGSLGFSSATAYYFYLELT